MPEWVYPYAEERPKFAQLVIPTLDSVRCGAQASLHSGCAAAALGWGWAVL